MNDTMKTTFHKTNYLKGLKCPKSHSGNQSFHKHGKNHYECQGCGYLITLAQAKKMKGENQ